MARRTSDGGKHPAAPPAPPSETERRIAARLRAARRLRGLTQDEVAHEIRRMRGGDAGAPHQSYVAKCERGLRRLYADELVEFAVLYGLPVGWFTDWVPETALPATPPPLGRPPGSRQRHADVEAYQAVGEHGADETAALPNNGTPSRRRVTAVADAGSERSIRAAQGPLFDAVRHDSGSSPSDGPDPSAPSLPADGAWAPARSRRPRGGVPVGRLLGAPPPYDSARRASLSALIATNAGPVIAALAAPDADLVEMYSELGETPLYEAVRLQAWGAALALVRSLQADPFRLQGVAWPAATWVDLPARRRMGARSARWRARDGSLLVAKPRVPPSGHPTGYPLARTPWLLALQLVHAAKKGGMHVAKPSVDTNEIRGPEDQPWQVALLRGLVDPGLTRHVALMGPPRCRLGLAMLREALSEGEGLAAGAGELIALLRTGWV